MAVYHPEKTVICSVKCLPDNAVNKLSLYCSKILVLDPTHCDIPRSEGISDKLSPDYSASIVAARSLFPEREFTVFDFGTCLNMLEYSSEETSIRTIQHEFSSRFTAEMVNMITSEIDNYISEYPSKVVIFTGGDANYFAKRMKNCIFVVCNLVLIGLALIAEKYE